MAENTFSVVDYVVFGAMLLISSVIGIYHACGGKQSSTTEYLMAGRNMPAFPIFVSLLASYLSAITLLGVPSEVYTYGIQYAVLLLSYLILIGCAGIIYAPIFYRLRVTSAHEYLERRFSPGVRSLGCLLFMLQYILYLSVVLYAPSLALEAVAGVPLAASIITTGLVCNFYTTLGGMKAVIYTDVFQASVMILGLIVVMIVGVMELGGFGEVFAIAKKGKRMNLFDFNPDPTVRNTFWTLSIGGAFTAMPVWTVSQTAVQRFMAAKSFKTMKWAVYLNIPGLWFVVILCVLDGLVIYGIYHDCDLKTDKKVTSNDQVLPYFIIHKLGHLKGVPGLFISCLFSGALSTASSGLNSIAAVTLEDIVKKIYPDLTDQKATVISKVTACIFGLLIIGGAFLVSFVGTMVLQLAYSIFGIIGGPFLGIFALGMFVPWATWQGAYGGTIIGVGTTLWLATGALIYPPYKHEAPISIAKCPSFNATLTNSTGIIPNPSKWKPHNVPLANWYAVSYLWYAAIGVCFTFVGGCLVSLLFGCGKSEEVDPILLFDIKGFFWSLVPRKCRPIEYNLRQDTDDLNNKVKYHDNDLLITKNLEQREEDKLIKKTKTVQHQEEYIALPRPRSPPPYDVAIKSRSRIKYSQSDDDVIVSYC